jgi:hypothetical protein
MTDQPKQRGFWQSLPGVLTAVAALITAVGGILALLLQVGLIGGDDDTSTRTQPATVQQQPTQSPAGATGGSGWEKAEAVWTTTAGETIRMPARTMGFCINSGGGVFFNENQNIAFEKMVSIEVVRSDVALSFKGRADVRIKLLAGELLTGTIDAGCMFIGNPDRGRVESYPDRIKKIEFVRNS